MKAPKGKWLDTALRAQQAKTLDHHYRVHDTTTAHEQAAQRESDALHGLQALASSWRKGRDAARLTKDLDGLYQRFHAQMRVEATDATHARVEHQQALDAALVHLRQSYALQQALGRTVERRDRLAAKDAQAREHGTSNEAWMLAQAGRKKGSE